MSYFVLNIFTLFTLLLLLSHLLLTSSASEAQKGEFLNEQTTLVDHDVHQPHLLEEEKPSMAKHNHFISHHRKLTKAFLKKKKKKKGKKSSATQNEMSKFRAGSILVASILFGFFLV
ncbi:hypothetical protein PIB30_051579 [Stylosanthes scabra]|uniref:Transmembrane protein n=1 Tax=Stylosanthes scabra TaxID=79078 RepID=A0ABU6TIH3_9FABA|nr:hypothetical protein [Stylosanthes scabra]